MMACWVVGGEEDKQINVKCTYYTDLETLALMLPCTWSQPSVEAGLSMSYRWIAFGV